MNNSDFALAESVSTTNIYYFIAVYILILVYCCFGLAVVCDVYFVPALQKLSYTYDLPPDIAGSTLMALGASVPELFASLIGVFVTEDDIGTGSIIGSSSFNLIAVPAACSFVASGTFGSGTLSVNPMPVTRNSAFYAITILVLLLIIKDNQVDIPESLILMLFFVMYMAFMIFCAQTKRSKHRGRRASTSSTTSAASNGKQSESLADSAMNSVEHDGNSTHNSVSSNQSVESYVSDRTSSLGDYPAKKNARIQSTRKSEYQPIDGAPKATISKHFPYNTNAIMDYKPVVLDSFANKPIIINEKTPLVSGKKQAQSFQNNPRFTENDTNNHFKYQMPIEKDWKINDANFDPNNFSVDLGIAIKNSTCLLKSTEIIHDSSIYKNNHDLILDTQKALKQSNVNPDEEQQHSDWISSNWILVPMFPLTLGMKVLMPGKFKTTFSTIWSFLISIGLIGALTYIAVWMVHLLGKLLGIPDTVAGMTILSWGTGIPELIASIVLIRKTAEADMAISNTIGSNVIDVSFCLSLPWIVKCLMNYSNGLEPIVLINSVALPWTTFLLLILVLILLIILKCHNWKLCYGVGIWLMLAYISFVISSIVLEYT